MAFSVGGNETMKKVCDALGLQGRAVSKIVLVMAADDIATLYVKEFPQRGQIEALVPVIEGMRVVPVQEVDVSDVGEVSYIPRKTE